MTKILVTGSAGLIGRPLVRQLRRDGYEVVELDLDHSSDEMQGDIRCSSRVALALRGCAGVIHLAAVARVLKAASDPERCRTTNVTGTRVVVEEARRTASCGWLVFASSREVYGQPAVLPVDENAPTQPLNLYGQSKLVGEGLVRQAERDGLAVGVARLTNTYGSVNDHLDRVVPAFALAAATGAQLRVEGAENRLDLLHVDDAVTGLVKIARRLASTKRSAPTVQLVSGTSVSIGELARLCVSVADSDATVETLPPRTDHVSRFVGDPAFALELLGWAPSIPLREGVARLVAAFHASPIDHAQKRSAS